MRTPINPLKRLCRHIQNRIIAGLPHQMRTLLLMASCTLLSECSYTDPSYDRLAPLVDTSPSVDAILGMWNRSYGLEYTGGNGTMCRSYLFKSDGTGFYRDFDTRDIGLFGIPANITTNDHQEELNWKYVGNGLWQIIFVNNTRPPQRVRIADTRLLIDKPGFFGEYYVFKPIGSP